MDLVNNSCSLIKSRISFGWPVASDCQGKVSFRQAFVLALRFLFSLFFFFLTESLQCVLEGKIFLICFFFSKVEQCITPQQRRPRFESAC